MSFDDYNFDEYLNDYYSFMQNPKNDRLQADLLGKIGSMEPAQDQQGQQLGRLLDKADTGAAQMAQGQEQANQQMIQQNQAFQQQKDSQMAQTEQDAANAMKQQQQDEAQRRSAAIGLVAMALPFIGGSGAAAGEAAEGAGTAAAEAGAEAGLAGASDAALAEMAKAGTHAGMDAAGELAARQGANAVANPSIWEKMGVMNKWYENPLFYGALQGPQAMFGQMASNYKRYGR